MQMYCVKCRTKKAALEVEYITMKNGKPAVKGKCPTDGTGMYKIANFTAEEVELSKILEIPEELRTQSHYNRLAILKLKV